MLSLKDEYTFRFSIFLIIGLCNLAANSWFCIITDLSCGVKASNGVRVTAPPELLTPEHLLSKYFHSIEGIPF